MTIRKPWVGGNWKCNGNTETIDILIKKLNEGHFNSHHIDVVICPPMIYMDFVKRHLKSDYAIGSQNVSATCDGAFTGEISINMLKDIGMSWTLIGHSERRQLYRESNDTIAAKVEIVQKTGIHSVVCIGEQLEEREAGKTLEVCTEQMKAIIPKVTDWTRIVIAYEPVWAIGTGKVATPEQAQETHKEIRALLASKVSKDIADSVRIVYGGSVTDSNCRELIVEEDIDGFLVGGASLKPSFLEIIAAANS